MTDEEMFQDKIEVVEEEVQEKNKEDTDETLTKPKTEGFREAIDTFVNFSMFTESGEIRTIAMKASTLFEKEPCESMKQTLISNFFKKRKKNYKRSLM